MTRRIAIAILVTTWAVLIAIGAGTYLATRHALLTDLDESIIARAVALPDILGVAETGATAMPEGDRYIIRNGAGRTLARPTTSVGPVTPVVINRDFTTLAGSSRLRTITLSLIKAVPGDASQTTTITYSTPAERFDRLLNRLVLWLVAIGLTAGVCAAAAAVVLSRITLRPLRKTAELIGDIDESKLDRRIDISALPTELGPMAIRLNEMLSRLEHSFDTRRRFLADASHELRTPVAGLMTTIEVALRRPRSADELTELLQACLSDAKTLRHLVDRVMQQVRSESSSFGEAPQQFDAVALMNECVDLVTRSRPDKHMDVICNLPEHLTLNTEKGRVRGIIVNLLSNAFEYTPSGGRIELACALGNKVAITVSDNGPGISAELLPRLFEPFFRGDQHRSVADGHLGLGLSIVQAHTRALGGECMIESTPGHGAIFTLKLPIELAVSTQELALK